MRNFRIVAMTYKQNIPKNERTIKKITDSLVMEIESPDETSIYFAGDFDEQKIRDNLDQIYMLCACSNQNLGVVVFDSLKYNPEKPQEYDALFCDMGILASELEITFVVLLPYGKDYSSLTLQDFQAEYGYDGGIEQDIELLISLEPMHPDKYVARVLKNRCGSTRNYLVEI